MLEILKKVALFNGLPKNYCCVFFKKYNYYLLRECDDILENRDCFLEKDKDISLYQSYSYIIRYSIKDEYLAVKKNDFNHIFILNKDFQEINRVLLKIPSIYKKEIKAIAYNYKAHKIMVVIADKLYSVTIDGDFIKEEITINAFETKNLRITKNTNSCCVKKCNLENFRFTSVGFVCGKVFVSYIKNNSAFISEISSNGNIVNTYYIDEDTQIKSIFEVNKNMQLLVEKANSYSYVYITNYCCCYNKRLKNYCKICFDKCKKPECHHECNDCEDIILSIALIEKSLARILNAEGEKIEKAINLAKNTSDLIKINETVSRVIVNITLLEQLLVEKLEMVLKRCKEDKDNKK